MGRYQKVLGSVKLKKVTRRGPGRPRKYKLAAETPELQQLMKNKKEFLKEDDLLNELANNPDSFDVLDRVMFELAEEAASLEFDRKEAERKDKDTSIFSSKKVTALKSVADVYFRKRDAMISEAFDFSSDRFQKFIEWFVEDVVLTASKDIGLSPEQINMLFEEVANRLDGKGWQDDALRYIQR